MQNIIIFLFLLIAPLNAALTFENNHEKEVQILESFDIEPSFLNERYFIKLSEYYRKEFQQKRFFKAMNDSYIFLPHIKEMIAQSGIPTAFLYLAMAESNFSTKAYSRKKASGLWQFMPATARLYGLKIDSYVDERRDLIKSTEAAIKYLKHAHNRFGKWYLAALAYNCGEGRVARAIKSAKTDELSVLLNARKKYVPRESRNYIRKILALALMANDENFLVKSEFDHLMNRANAYSLSTVYVPKGERLSHIAKSIQMKHEDLKALNRHLRYDFVPPYGEKYAVYIPYIKLADFKVSYIPSAKQRYYVHNVKKGDSLYKIGKKYGVGYKMIKDFNRLKSNRLSLKQKLIIPKIYDANVKSKQNYRVRSGDTLQKIARHFDMSVEKLMKVNTLKNSVIKTGEKLVVYN